MGFLDKLRPKWMQRSQEQEIAACTPGEVGGRALSKAKRKKIRESRRVNRGQAVGFNSGRRHKGRSV